MIYNGDLVKINGVKLPHIKQYKIGRAKLWKSAERNMSGEVRATLIGIFPKITIEIGCTTQDEISQLTSLLDQDYFIVEWFDVRVQEIISTKYYASDYDIELLDKNKGLYKPFSVNLIPVSKRRY